MRALFSLGLVLLSTVAVGAPEGTRRVSLVLQGSVEQTPVEGSVSIRRLDRPGTEVVERPAASRLDLELDRRGSYRVELEIAGQWAAPLSIDPGSPPAIDVQLIATGRLSGRLVVPPAAEPPQELRAFLWPTVAERPSARVPFRGRPFEGACHLEPTLAYACELPAGRWDVKLRAPGFRSHYIQGIAIDPQKPTAIPPLVVKPGASISGLVVVDEGTIDDSCRATARPLGAEHPERPEGRERHEDELSVPVDADGFFHLSGLAAGRWLVAIEQDGYSPALVSPIDLLEGMEAQLHEPVELFRPVTLDLTVRPRRDPQSRPWRLRVFQRTALGGSQRVVGEAEVGTDGTVTIPGLGRGVALLHLTSQRGETYYRREHDLDRGRVGVEVDLDLVAVRGTVYRRGEPLADARLAWWSVPPASSADAVTDEEGRFSLLLPRAEKWAVHIQTGAVDTTLVDVVVPETENDEAKVDLELPDTEVRGVVVHEDGRPEAGAEIQLISSARWSRPAFLLPAADGSFVIEGATPGPAVLQAGLDNPLGQSASQAEQIVVPEEGSIEGLRLILRQWKEVRGRVVSDRGPVHGAVLAPWARTRLTAAVEPVRSGPDGEFVLLHPPQMNEVVLGVFAPGHALRAFDLDLDTGPFQLFVEPGGARLRVVLPQGSEWIPRPFVLQDGRPLSLLALSELPARRSGEVVYGDLAPGPYRVCVAENALPAPADFLLQSLVGASCQETTLVQGDETTVIFD